MWFHQTVVLDLIQLLPQADIKNNGFKFMARIMHNFNSLGKKRLRLSLQFKNWGIISGSVIILIRKAIKTT